MENIYDIVQFFFIDNVIILLASQSYHLDIWLSYRKPCKDSNNCLVDPSTKNYPFYIKKILLLKATIWSPKIKF